MISRFNLLLLAALLVSALYLVRTSYESRRLFVAIEGERKRAQQLQAEYEQLEVAQRKQGTPLRVEKIARDKLRMFGASPALTQYVGLPGGALPASAAASGGAR